MNIIINNYLPVHPFIRFGKFPDLDTIVPISSITLNCKYFLVDNNLNFPPGSVLFKIIN